MAEALAEIFVGVEKSMDASAPFGDSQDGRPSRRFVWASLLMAFVTVMIVGGAAWLRFAHRSSIEPPMVGSVLPPLRLLDLQSLEPIVLLGLKGRIVWVVFWSPGSETGRTVLPQLEQVWRRLRSHGRFSMVAAALDPAQSERVREALAEVHATLPVYLATPETRRRFGVHDADPPLHLLIDERGQIAALARGAGQATIDRLASQARAWLDELDPMRNTRFASVR
jgi:hypothetical protein